MALPETTFAAAESDPDGRRFRFETPAEGEMADSAGQSESRLDEIAKQLFGFFASRGCGTEFCDRPGYRVLDVFHRDRDGLLHVYYGCFPKDMPDAECMREAVRDFAHMPSGRREGRPITAFGFLGLGGIRSFDELEIKLAVMGA